MTRPIFVTFHDEQGYWVAQLEIGRNASVVAGPFARLEIASHICETRAWQTGDIAEWGAWPDEYEELRAQWMRELSVCDLPKVCWIAKLAEGKLL